MLNIYKTNKIRWTIKIPMSMFPNHRIFNNSIDNWKGCTKINKFYRYTNHTKNCSTNCRGLFMLWIVEIFKFTEVQFYFISSSENSGTCNTETTWNSIIKLKYRILITKNFVKQKAPRALKSNQVIKYFGFNFSTIFHRN